MNVQSPTSTVVGSQELSEQHVASLGGSHQRWSQDSRATLPSVTTSRTDGSKRDSAVSGAASNGRDNIDNDPLVTIKSKRQKARDIGHEVKIKTKSLLRKHKASPEEAEAEEEEDEYANPYTEIDTPAFDTAQLAVEKPRGAGATAQRTLNHLMAGADAVIHPIHAAKRKAASKVAVEEEPYLSTQADVDLLAAHDNLDETRSRSHGSGRLDEVDTDSNGQHEERLEQDEQRIRNIEDTRDNRKVAWITSHHIKRVLVVSKRSVPAPEKKDFYVYDETTGTRKLDWQSWLSACNRHGLLNFANNSMGHVDYAGRAPFDRDVMTRQIQRLLMASSPWQSWFSSLRQLYRWEDRKKSRNWFLVWFVVWYLDYTVSFSLAYIAFKVLENRLRTRNINALRESYTRSRDRDTATYKFSELITKHGNDKWLDPAMEQLGPMLQMQVTDLASFLEILNNFYEWRVPRLTWATLFWFLCAVSLGTMTSSRYSVKIVWMSCILQFFLGYWVRSWYPEYRRVTNSLMWIFWDIPDDSEWSMMYLREKAQDTRARIIEKRVQKRHDGEVINAPTAASPVDARSGGSTNTPGTISTNIIDEQDDNDNSDAESFVTADSSNDILNDLDILSFHCHYKSHRGRLVISSSGLGFTRHYAAIFAHEEQAKERESWHRPWSELVEMRKIEVKTSALVSKLSSLSSSSALVLGFDHGETKADKEMVIKFQDANRRDRAFNCLVGFSGLKFQVLPITAEPVVVDADYDKDM